MHNQPSNGNPEQIVRKIVMDCADCDCCRPIMDEACKFFPELYRLYDQETATGQQITASQIRQLVDRCHFCALCPCPNIRADIIRAKTAFVAREGLPWGVRALVDVERAAKVCGALPMLANTLLKLPRTGEVVKRCLGIHPVRRMPEVPNRSFKDWVRQERLNQEPKGSYSRKVAYFAGCTAAFLFPEVGIAAVKVLRQNGIGVWFPMQACCGMPAFLEGDRRRTLEMAGRNLETLTDAVRRGYDVLCSCPTCSFMLRSLMGEGAYYSEQYQSSVGADTRYIVVPVKQADQNPDQERRLEKFDRVIYQKILRDEGYFSSLNPLKRIGLLERTFDVGEYLINLHASGNLGSNAGAIHRRILYFAPCHQREQEFGQPYPSLLKLIPGIKIDSVEGNLYCCGMGGLMGFKREFHEDSAGIGKRLMSRIREINPEVLVTDCLSCRLQFKQMLPYPVLHPVELLNEAFSRGAAPS
jgi:glycerol-3-phosphate dehydrogenase subunit C